LVVVDRSQQFTDLLRLSDRSMIGYNNRGEGAAQVLGWISISATSRWRSGILGWLSHELGAQIRVCHELPTAGR